MMRKGSFYVEVDNGDLIKVTKTEKEFFVKLSKIIAETFITSEWHEYSGFKRKGLPVRKNLLEKVRNSILVVEQNEGILTHEVLFEKSPKEGRRNIPFHFNSADKAYDYVKTIGIKAKITKLEGEEVLRINSLYFFLYPEQKEMYK